MKKFDYLSELKKFIDQKQLVKIFFGNDNTYFVAYIIKVNESNIVFASVSPSGEFQGLEMHLLDNINSIETETDSLNEMAKQIDGSAFAQQLKKFENIETFPSDKFIKSKTLVQITINSDEDFVGRLSDIGKKMLVLDEYSIGVNHRTSRTILNKFQITRISIGSPALQALDLYLKSINV